VTVPHQQTKDPSVILVSDLPFHPATVRWFADTLGRATVGQRRGWASIRDGRHTLIAAPTGSGKTLAAFLTTLDDLPRKGCAVRRTRCVSCTCRR
jgi:ATP-dependent Lhr-like helicase